MESGLHQGSQVDSNYAEVAGPSAGLLSADIGGTMELSITKVSMSDPNPTPESTSERNPYESDFTEPEPATPASVVVDDVEGDSDRADIAIRFAIPAIVSGIVSGLLGPRILLGVGPGIAYGIALTVGLQSQFRKTTGATYVVVVFGTTVTWIGSLLLGRTMTFAEVGFSGPMKWAVMYGLCGAVGGLGISLLMTLIIGHRMLARKVVVTKVTIAGAVLGIVFMFVSQSLSPSILDVSTLVKVQMLMYVIWQVGLSVTLAWHVIPASGGPETGSVNSD